MIDIKKAINGLQQCLMSSLEEGYETQCYDCPYFEHDEPVKKCTNRLKNDVFTSLLDYRKKNTPVAKEIEGGSTTWWLVCPECHGNIDSNDSFCRHCGQAVKKE